MWVVMMVMMVMMMMSPAQTSKSPSPPPDWKPRQFKQHVQYLVPKGHIAHEPPLFYVLPLQSWLDWLAVLVNKMGTLETDWLPVFAIASTHLRSVLARIHTRDRDHRSCSSIHPYVDGRVSQMLFGTLRSLSITVVLVTLQTTSWPLEACPTPPSS